VQNKDNSIFRLRYRYNLGTWNDKKLAIAAQYLSFLGTDKMSAEDITKEFYKIACSFTVNAGNEFTTVTIEGLQENFDKAVSLFENLLANCKADETALTALKARLQKSRTDAKANKSAIMSGLTSYARYGANNPFNYVMSDAQLQGTSSAELIEMLHNMKNVSHRILYYGPLPLGSLTASMKKLHSLPTAFQSAGSPVRFTPVTQTKNEVLFADYNMVQAETRWLRNNELYNPKDEGIVDLFNSYFGGGMGAIVFQTIRESKALAYSTFAIYATPDKKEDPFFTVAYVGSQADKFNEAVTAMNELLNEVPEIESNIAFAKSNLKKDIETQRIVQDAIIFNYLDAERKGLKEDIRKAKYEGIDKLGFKDLKEFHDKYVSHKPYTYAIVASEKKLSMDDMKKYGEVKKLSLEEIFGY
jgi:predicted Zn-dependent peptidase